MHANIKYGSWTPAVDGKNMADRRLLWFGEQSLAD